MQQIKSFEILMEYSDIYETKFSNAKYLLEKLGHEIRLFSNYIPDYCYFSKIDNSIFLSICIHNNNIEFGLYNSRTRQISQALNERYYCLITDDVYNQILLRMKNVYNSVINHTYKTGILDKDWQSFLREKYKDNSLIFPGNDNQKEIER